MELQAADTHAGSPPEAGCCVVAARQKCDAVEGRAILGGYLDAESGQVLLRIRHQALATRLIDGRTKGIGDENIQTFLPQGDGGCEARGTASGNECITTDHSGSPVLPLQQQHLRTKARPHGGQNAACSRLRLAMGHHLIQHYEH
jgi:hypothetical protein